CLGAARRQKKPPRSPLRGSLPPEGAFLPWGGPAAKKPHAVAWRQYDIWEPHDPVAAFILTNVAFKEPIQSQAATPRKA
ncbi:hypothetical protein ACOTJC_14640, partial [Achromobacter xylosoxidans]|nr:hypothetical protein [Achromobacter xylosoxidans]